jgi:hypothetical protein
MVKSPLTDVAVDPEMDAGQDPLVLSKVRFP